MPQSAVGPGQQATPKAIKAMPSHASYRDGNSGQFRAEQEPAHEGWNHQQRQARGGFGDGGNGEQLHFNPLRRQAETPPPARPGMA